MEEPVFQLLGKPPKERGAEARNPARVEIPHFAGTEWDEEAARQRFRPKRPSTTLGEVTILGKPPEAASWSAIKVSR